MSPVSRGRKKPKSEGKGRGGRQPNGRLSAPPRTPDYAKAERRVFGPEAPAEVKLLTVLSDAWQVMAHGLPANHCIHAVAAIRSTLAEWGVDSEPVVVAATVEWPNMRVDVGSSPPSWEPTGGWSGHLGLWIPLLGRFMDPSLYQANRPQAPAQIERGIIIPMHPRDLGGRPFGTAYGAAVTYRVITGIDVLDSLPPRGEVEVRTSAERYRSFVHEVLYDDPHVAEIRRGLTVEPLATVLAVDPTGDR